MKEEELRKIVESILSDNFYLFNTVFEIAKRINNMPFGIVTTIGRLIEYDPEKNFVDPNAQSMIYDFVIEVCKKANIKIEEISDIFKGEAFHYKIRKFK